MQEICVVEDLAMTDSFLDQLLYKVLFYKFAVSSMVPPFDNLLSVVESWKKFKKNIVFLFLIN